MDVDLDGCGPGGKAELRAFIVQVRVLENHQNGKDTHVRGVQIFAGEERVGRAEGFGWEGKDRGNMARKVVGAEEEEGEVNLNAEPDFPEWMDDPVIR